MTLEEFILSRSFLPQNGTYTLTDHIMAMMMYVQGVESKLTIEDKRDVANVLESTDVINVSTARGKLVVSNKLTGVVVSRVVDNIVIKD